MSPYIFRPVIRLRVKTSRNSPLYKRIAGWTKCSLKPVQWTLPFHCVKAQPCDPKFLSVCSRKRHKRKKLQDRMKPKSLLETWDEAQNESRYQRYVFSKKYLTLEENESQEKAKDEKKAKKKKRYKKYKKVMRFSYLQMLQNLVILIIWHEFIYFYFYLVYRCIILYPILYFSNVTSFTPVIRQQSNDLMIVRAF